MLDDNAVLTAPTVLTLEGSSGLFAEVLANGALRRLEAFGTSLLLHPATVAEAGLTNVHLRVHRPDGIRRRALLGPGQRLRRHRGRRRRRPSPGTTSRSTTASSCASATRRSTPTWHWDLELTNTSDEPVTADVVLTHDPALAPLGAVRTNEYYVSQYLDISPVATTGHGTAVAVRQNMPGQRVPWLMVGTHRHRHRLGDRRPPARRAHRRAACAGPASTPPTCRARASSTSTRSSRCRTPRPRSRPADTHRTGFWGIALEDHPEATSDADARWADVAVATHRRASTAPGTDHGAAEPDLGHAVVVQPRLPLAGARPRRARRRGPARRPHPRRDGRRRHRARLDRPRRPARHARQGAARSCARTATCSAPATPSPPTPARSPRRSGWRAPSTRRSPAATSAATPSSPGAAPTSASSAPTASASSSRTPTVRGRSSRPRARGSPASTTARGGMPPRRVPCSP